jgi:hypothetical protein
MNAGEPSRRAMLAARAWAVPAVAVASAAPAFAGSGGVTSVTYLLGWVSSGLRFDAASNAYMASASALAHMPRARGSR